MDFYSPVIQFSRGRYVSEQARRGLKMACAARLIFSGVSALYRGRIEFMSSPRMVHMARFWALLMQDVFEKR